ncbi:IS256 family transposase, partial [Rhodococcus rhodochrous]
MTHDHSALLAQLDALTGADSASVFAELIRTGLQALIEAEATDKLGAGRYERTNTRTTHRNGHRTKTVATTSGDVEVKIPKLRSGSFFPSLLERRRRIDKALYAVVMEAYVHGVSTRSVDDLVGALGVGSGISKSEVSRICAGLDAEIARFRERTLTHTSFPYVFLDATFCKVRVGAHVVSQALVVATGVSIDGTREVLGTAVGDSESFEFWREFLTSLKARGLSGVHLVISDAHSGLKAAVMQQFAGSSWQRCRVHCDCKELMCRFGCVALLLWYRGEQGGGGAVADGCRQRGVAVLFEQWPHVEQRIADGAGADLEQLGQDSAGAQAPQVQHSGQDTFGIGDLLKEDSAAAPGHPFAAALGVAASFDHGGLPNGEAFDEFVQLPATHAGQSRMRQCFGEQPIRCGDGGRVITEKSREVGGGAQAQPDHRGDAVAVFVEQHPRFGDDFA